MSVPIKIRVVEERPPDVSGRAWTRFMREAHTDQGELWHSEMLPRHFVRGASSRYGYEPRSKGWQQRKARLFQAGVAVKRNTDLVLTGLLKQTMEDFGTIRGFPSRVTVTMQGPRYITMRPNKSNQPDKAAEVTATTPDEEQRLADKLNRGVTERLNAHRQPRTQTF